MDESSTLHLVAPSGPGRERLARELGHLEPVLHDSIEDFNRHAGPERCTVIVDVDGGVDCHAFLGLCRDVADQDRPWIVLAVSGGAGDSLSFRPVSAGFPVGADALAELVEKPGEGGFVFDLHEVLRLVARIRHDINNPLTAGLAETQLLLMDVGREGEAGESLSTIERQLQRIQGLVQQLTRFRRPAPKER